MEHLLILASEVTWCVSISAFAPLVGTSIRIASFAALLHNFAITTGNKNYKSIIRKRRKIMIK